MGYDHRRHAGNAGDVWKHLILAEVADHLLGGGVRVYVESHAGRPEYRLRPGGEWEGGIGRLWPCPEPLAKYRHLQILGERNSRGLERYPGSASIVLELADRRGVALEAELWDKSPEVERAWRSREWSEGTSTRHFHLGDGFSGVSDLLDRLKKPALLLIDSPYLEKSEASLVEDLISKSSKAGWVALSWQPADLVHRLRPDCNLREFELSFEEVGLESHPLKGASMILAWDGEATSITTMEALEERLEGIEKDLHEVGCLKSESF
ncbi:MAG TPA: 23S rRNA (adenine(2030)-N(6))-methyltransferase RlmJ [Methanothrix sp.]|nr:23S rRNA (adenine(2030)-N(6))-methyltransferase RlmJ [Methanothrix sp.]